jgi:hypothetical protein
MPISFPYPSIGTVVRPAGQGCSTCVHQEYGQALYWNTRFNDYVPSVNHGIACESWSNDPSQRITVITPDDISENNRLAGVAILPNGDPVLTENGVLCEPNRNGIIDAVTGTDKEYYW